MAVFPLALFSLKYFSRGKIGSTPNFMILNQVPYKCMVGKGCRGYVVNWWETPIIIITLHSVELSWIRLICFDIDFKILIKLDNFFDSNKSSFFVQEIFKDSLIIWFFWKHGRFQETSIKLHAVILCAEIGENFPECQKVPPTPAQQILKSILHVKKT